MFVIFDVCLCKRLCVLFWSLLVNALQLGQKKEKNSDLGFENVISK
jgi:hypothetical protein